MTEQNELSKLTKADLIKLIQTLSTKETDEPKRTWKVKERAIPLPKPKNEMFPLELIDYKLENWKAERQLERKQELVNSYDLYIKKAERDWIHAYLDGIENSTDPKEKAYLATMKKKSEKIKKIVKEKEEEDKQAILEQKLARL